MSFPAGSSLPLAGLPIDRGQPEALRPGPSLGQPVRSGQPGGCRGHGGEEPMEAHSGALRAVLSLSPGLAAPPARPGMVAWAAGSQLRTAGRGPTGTALPLRPQQRLSCALRRRSHAAQRPSQCVCPGGCATRPAPEQRCAVKHWRCSSNWETPSKIRMGGAASLHGVRGPCPAAAVLAAARPRLIRRDPLCPACPEGTPTPRAGGRPDLLGCAWGAGGWLQVSGG